ncbi:unnamed protein product, partial [Hapterophycus canaliculatus]
ICSRNRCVIFLRFCRSCGCSMFGACLPVAFSLSSSYGRRNLPVAGCHLFCKRKVLSSKATRYVESARRLFLPRLPAVPMRVGTFLEVGWVRTDHMNTLIPRTLSYGPRSLRSAAVMAEVSLFW